MRPSIACSRVQFSVISRAPIADVTSDDPGDLAVALELFQPAGNGSFEREIALPQAEGDGVTRQLGGRIALAALDKSMAEFSADPSRVYLTGLSMGGNGAWYLAYHHSDRNR